MKNKFIFLVCLTLCGCATSSKDHHSEAGETPADTAKQMYWQLQQSRASADEAPHYRRLTITVPAHAEGGVNYEEQTRTVLIAE
jgi:uncharacterized protein YceK